MDRENEAIRLAIAALFRVLTEEQKIEAQEFLYIQDNDTSRALEILRGQP